MIWQYWFWYLDMAVLCFTGDVKKRKMAVDAAVGAVDVPMHMNVATQKRNKMKESQGKFPWLFFFL